MVIWSKFPNEGSHILGVAVSNSVWRLDLCTHDVQYYVRIGNQRRFICQRNWLAPWSTLQSKLERGGEVTLLSIWSGYKLQGKRSLQPNVLCYPAQEWTRSDMKAKICTNLTYKVPHVAMLSRLNDIVRATCHELKVTAFWNVMLCIW